MVLTVRQLARGKFVWDTIAGSRGTTDGSVWE